MEATGGERGKAEAGQGPESEELHFFVRTCGLKQSSLVVHARPQDTVESLLHLIQCVPLRTCYYGQSHCQIQAHFRQHATLVYSAAGYLRGPLLAASSSWKRQRRLAPPAASAVLAETVSRLDCLC
jgi:hypothetical protein